MPRRSSAELVRKSRAAMVQARSLLASGDVKGAAEAARLGFSAARAQRSHLLLSEAWITLLETLGADPENDLTLEYREFVEGAFSWAETMPEEIQVWLFLALEPHLAALGFTRLVTRGRARLERARTWLEGGGVNVMTRLQEFHLADLAAGRTIDRKALALERTAGFYAAEHFDPDGVMLVEAAAAWRRVGRADRADFVEALAAELRRA